MRDAPLIFLSSAEASGDDHAARLIRAIRLRIPSARFVGAAGPAMQEAGCESLMDLTGRASMVMGPLGNLRFWRRVVKQLQGEIVARQPDLFIPTDSPALNWHLCKTAKSVGTTVLHFIAPQVWAWARWRIKKVRRFSDHIACLLPFEQEYFRERGVAATFVGNPVFDDLPPEQPVETMPDLLEAWSEGNWRVALLPGSRQGEIRNHAAALAETARRIQARWPAAQCTFTARNEQAKDRIAQALDGEAVQIEVGQTADVLQRSHFAIAASGTVTLEVAGLGVPMVVLHRLRGIERLGYPIARRFLLHTRFLSLPNILAGREIVPELMPWTGNVDVLAGRVLETMNNVGYLVEARQKLLDTTRPLRSEPGQTAAGRTAELVEELLR